MTDLMEVWISRIWNRQISHSGEDYPKRLSSLLGSEFLAGELMKLSRSYKQGLFQDYTPKFYANRILTRDTGGGYSIVYSFEKRV